jgi:uncharacterized protein YccT (UPF0319 family)
MSILTSPKLPSMQILNGFGLALSLGVAGLSTSTFLWADAEISVPENVIVLAIDGQDTGNTGFFARRLTTYRLPTGEHTITARYDGVFAVTNSDNDDIVRSNGVTLRTTLSDQQIYTLGWQPEPKTHEEALALVKQPTLIIRASSGSVVASQQGAVMPSTSLLGGVIKGIDRLAGSVVPYPSTTPLKQLELSWQQASTEQKEQFRNWINQKVNQ